MRLTEHEQGLLAGDAGPGAAFAMELLVAVAEAENAPGFVEISQAHIDGCLYHAQVLLDFAKQLLELGTRVAVPTTLNVSSLDLLHPELYRGDAGTAADAKRLMDAHVEMGCQPTWTCAPYQLASVPRFGEHVAWGESNAIVFANSVLGARTGRYGDFMDMLCAVTGRAPNTGMHTDSGRLATVEVVIDIPDEVLDSDLAYPLIGYVTGRAVGQSIPALVGLPTCGHDDLKALGAAAASAGTVGMFHAVGITPEAATFDQATGGAKPVSVVQITTADLAHAKGQLTRGSGKVGAVSLGTPHYSFDEIVTLSQMVGGRTSKIPFYVNTSRDVADKAEASGHLEILTEFGATLVTDTCTYVTPIMEPVSGDVMTNSGKWAYYAPGNLGVGVAFGSLRDCVESAVAGVKVDTESLI